MKNTTVTSLQVGIVSFQEDDCFYVYCPSLNLIGCGHDEKEANESFNIVLDEYISYTEENNTLIEDLEKHGWKIEGNTKKITPPLMFQSFRKNKDLGRIVNKLDFKKQSIPFEVTV